MSSNVDLQPLVKDAIRQDEWVEPTTMTNQITVFLVDMQLVGYVEDSITDCGRTPIGLN